MAGPGDLGCKLSVVGPFIFPGILSTKGDHAPREAGKVSHLVVQNSSAPLSDVGQAPRRDIHQIGLYGLGGGEDSVVREQWQVLSGPSVPQSQCVAGALPGAKT